MSQTIPPTFWYPGTEITFIPIESPYQVYLGVEQTPATSARNPLPVLPNSTSKTLGYYFELSPFTNVYNGTNFTFVTPSNLFPASPYNFNIQIPFIVDFPAYSGSEIIDVPFNSVTVTDDLSDTYTVTPATDYFQLDRYSYLNVGPTITGDVPVPIDTSTGLSRGTFNYLAQYPAFNRGNPQAGKTVSLQLSLTEGQTLDIDPSIQLIAGVLVLSANQYRYKYLPQSYGVRPYLAHDNEVVTLHVGSHPYLAPENQQFNLVLNKTAPKQVYATIGVPLTGGYGWDQLYYPHSIATVSEDQFVLGSIFGTMKFTDRKTWITTSDQSLYSSYYSYYNGCYFAAINNNIYVHATQMYGQAPFPSEIYCLTPVSGTNFTNGWTTTLMGHITGEGNNWGGVAVDANYLYVAIDGSARIYKYDLTTYARTLITTSGSTPVDGVFGVAKIVQPGGMWRDLNSNWLYFSDSSTIRRLDVTDNSIQTISGTFLAGTFYREGVGAASRWAPQAGGMDGNSTHLYVADSYSAVVRSIDLTTFQTALVAGTPPVVDANGQVQSYNSGCAEGNRIGECQFSQPRGLVLEDGGLFVTDPSNMVIWKITLP
jgi:hypothetical protein